MSPCHGRLHSGAAAQAPAAGAREPGAQAETPTARPRLAERPCPRDRSGRRDALRPLLPAFLVASVALASLALAPAPAAFAAGGTPAPGGTAPAGAGSTPGTSPGSSSGQITSADAVSDIKASFAYYDILQLMQAGDIPVPTDGLFHPNDPVTRLDFTLWLGSALGLAPSQAALPFTDTATLSSQEQQILSAAVAAGLIQGLPDKTFAPEATITRAQLTVIFGRELAAKGQTPDSRFFAIWKDGATIPAWALLATIPMEDGLIDGLPCTPEACFGPDQTATRAQAATLIVRYMAYLTAHFHQAPLPTAQVGGFLMGFWDSGTDEAYANLTAAGGAINLVVDGGYDILPGGTLSGFDNARNLAWAAKHPDVEMWMMVQAMSAEQYAFLDSPTQEQSIISAVVTAVQRAGYAGVDFDIEVPLPAERAHFTAFIGQAAAALHAVGAKISVDVTVPIAPDPSTPDVGPYDYAALGAECDRVNLMTYSYHWPGGWPGPVAPLAWDQAALQFATRYIAPSKVMLGLPAYGYIWNQASLGATAYWVDGMHNEAAAHGAPITYDATSGENTFTYNADGPHVGWFVDGQGLQERVALAHQMGIAGVIAWRLDYGVGSWWPQWTQLFAEFH